MLYKRFFHINFFMINFSLKLNKLSINTQVKKDILERIINKHDSEIFDVIKCRPLLNIFNTILCLLLSNSMHY